MIIRTPNADSLFFKISILLFRLSFGRLRFPLFYLYHADHRFFFNKKSLTKMLDSSGFKALNFPPTPFYGNVLNTPNAGMDF